MTKQKEMPSGQDLMKVKALDMQMAWEYKLRRHWKDCPNCHHIIAPEGHPRICLCGERE